MKKLVRKGKARDGQVGAREDVLDDIGFHRELKKMFRIRFKEDGELVDEKIKVENITKEESISKNDKGRKNEVSLRDPKLKLIHRVLVNAVLYHDYSRGKILHTDVWLMSLIPARHTTNVPWIITTYLFNRAVKKRDTGKIRGGNWAHNLTMAHPYKPSGVPDMQFPMYPPPSPPTNSNARNVVQACSSQNVGVYFSIVGSLGHENNDEGAAPSHGAKLVEYDDGMDEDDV
nr:hypothetical protein [Tanacetum cinerariifolium]